MFIEIIQVAAGSLIDNGYEPNKVSFHSPGHLQRWANSPLHNQDPHLLTVFFIVLIVTAIVIVWKVNRSRQNAVAGDNEIPKLSNLVVELEAKEKRLIGKIAELDKKFYNGEIEQNEYHKLCHQHKKALDNVIVKLKEIEELDNAHC